MEPIQIIISIMFVPGLIAGVILLFMFFDSRKTPMDDINDLAEVRFPKFQRSELMINARAQIESLRLDVLSSADREEVQVLRKKEFDSLCKKYMGTVKAGFPLDVKSGIERMTSINEELEAEARKNNVVEFKK